MAHIACLPGRAVIAVEGDDRVSFLNGLVSNDVALAVPGRAIWAALLSPQGKYIADFFVIADGARLLLECEAAQRDMLVTKLSRFRLRAKVSVAAVAMGVFAAWGDAAPEVAGLVAEDTRLPGAGWRVLSGGAVTADASFAAWDAHRLALGLPDGSRDMEIDKTVLLEAGFDELGGVSWTKGCYMGQELTARTRYRGLLKRRLLPVVAEGTVPAPGTAIMAGERVVGDMRSGAGGRGLAVLRLDALREPLLGGGVALRVDVPGWVKLPDA